MIHFPFFYKKGKRFLFANLLLISSFSCKKLQIETASLKNKDAKPEMLSAVKVLLSSPNLLYEENFEGYGPYFYNGSMQVATSYGFQLDNGPLYQGLRVGRFELRDTDPENGGGTRAEAKYPPLTNSNRWYSYAVYFPSTNYLYDSKPEIINQWHQGAGENPSISLITRYDKLSLEIRSVPTIKTQFDLGSIVKNKWHLYVFHIIHSHSSDGLVEVWRNGIKIFTRNGANAYDYSLYDKPLWKFGVYKWEWNGTLTTDTKKRVIFFDNVRVGNENATYQDMVAPALQTLNPPGTIKSFTLVNAFTEKDIMTITDSAIISLAKVGTGKLNIRANPGATMGSVKFVLSGLQSKTTKDNSLPFSLMGDDGIANYYYSNWDPPAIGNYTLKATPYYGLDATGLVGITSTIHFSFIK